MSAGSTSSAGSGNSSGGRDASGSSVVDMRLLAVVPGLIELLAEVIDGAERLTDQVFEGIPVILFEAVANGIVPALLHFFPAGSQHFQALGQLGGSGVEGHGITPGSGTRVKPPPAVRSAAQDSRRQRWPAGSRRGAAPAPRRNRA